MSPYLTHLSTCTHAQAKSILFLSKNNCRQLYYLINAHLNGCLSFGTLLDTVRIAFMLYSFICFVPNCDGNEKKKLRCRQSRRRINCHSQIPTISLSTTFSLHLSFSIAPPVFSGAHLACFFANWWTNTRAKACCIHTYDTAWHGMAQDTRTSNAACKAWVLIPDDYIVQIFNNLMVLKGILNTFNLCMLFEIFESHT